MQSTLLDGNVPQDSEQFLATYVTGDANQVGTIRDYFKSQYVRMESLDSFTQDSDDIVNGQYTIFLEKNNQEDVLQQLSSIFQVSEEEMLNPSYAVKHSEPDYVLFIGISGILLLVFVIVCLFYPILITKEIWVYKLLGYNTFDVFKKISLKEECIPLIVGFVVAIVQKILYPALDLKYFAMLMGVEVALVLISAMIQYISIWHIYRYSLSEIMKGNIHNRVGKWTCYMLKFVVFVILVSLFPTLSENINSVWNNMHAYHTLERKTEEYGLVSYKYIGDEFSQSLSGKDPLEEKMTDLFYNLEENAGAQFIQTSSYDWNSLQSYASQVDMTGVNLPKKIDVVKCDSNYLKENTSLYQEAYFKNGPLTVLFPDSMKENR